MCFSEFIGYTCGHSSPEVLRPCPMTTQFYTNPVCTKHARRPILAPEMCPACQRVIHNRAVLITEWEHRWMHERGVCGCEVRFPDLIRPRVVSRSRPGQTIGRLGQMRNNTPASTYNAAARMPLSKAERSNAAGSKGVPAHYQEQSTNPGQRNVEVAVRIPSLFGAEWVDEHRQLHKDGSCKCAGDFSFYETPGTTQIVSSSSALVDNGPGQVVPTKTTTQSLEDHGHRSFQKSAPSHYLNPKDPSPQVQSQNKVLHNSHPHLSSLQVDTLTQQSSSNKASSLDDTPSTPSQLRGADRATTRKPPPLVVSSYYPPAPQRSPGAIYEVDPTKSTNRLYNHACNGAASMAALADFQSVEFPRAEGTLPLVGLPIGAGPEGAPGLPHVGDFEDCVLHTRTLIASLGDEPAPCLLATKSKSFACLRRAFEAWDDEEGLGRLHEALPAREHTRSEGSSAEPSEYEDSGAEDEDDQLYLS